MTTTHQEWTLRRGQVAELIRPGGGHAADVVVSTGSTRLLLRDVATAGGLRRALTVSYQEVDEPGGALASWSVTLDPSHAYGPLRPLVVPGGSGRDLGIEVGTDYRGNVLVAAVGADAVVRAPAGAVRVGPAEVLTRHELFALQTSALAPRLEVAARTPGGDGAGQLRAKLRDAVAAATSGIPDALILHGSPIRYASPDQARGAAHDWRNPTSFLFHSLTNSGRGLGWVLDRLPSQPAAGPGAGHVDLPVEIPGVTLSVRYECEGTAVVLTPAVRIDTAGVVLARPQPTRRQAENRERSESLRRTAAAHPGRAALAAAHHR